MLQCVLEHARARVVRRLGFKSASDAIKHQSRLYEESRNGYSESNAHDALLISIINTSAVIQKQRRQHINDLLTRLSKTKMDDDMKESLKSPLDLLGQIRTHRCSSAKTREAILHSPLCRGSWRLYYAARPNPFLARKFTPGTGLLNRYICRSNDHRGPDVTTVVNALVIRRNKNLVAWQKETWK